MATRTNTISDQGLAALEKQIRDQRAVMAEQELEYRAQRRTIEDLKTVIADIMARYQI